MQGVRGRFSVNRSTAVNEIILWWENQSVVGDVKALSQRARAENIPKIILHIFEPLICAETL